MFIFRSFSGVKNWLSLRFFRISAYSITTSSLKSTLLRRTMLAILSAYALLASLRLFKRTSSTLLINPPLRNIVRVLHKIGLVRIFFTNKRHFQRKITNAMENLGKPVVAKRAPKGFRIRCPHRKAVSNFHSRL